MRMLIVEDDAALGTFLDRGFGAEHYVVDVAAVDHEVVQLAVSRAYDAVIFDLHVVQPEELTLLRQIRVVRQDLPILILADPARPEERVQVLDAGADDLLLKPFAFAELAARVRAMLRRCARAARAVDTILRVDDLELNRVEHCVKRAGKKIELTPKEFALLEYLMRNCGRHVTRAEIVEHVWNVTFDRMTNVVDVYINYVRKKVDATSDRKLVHTIRGVGYQLQAPAAAIAPHALPECLRAATI